MLLLKFDVIIIKYVWICLNKQGSEYAWGPKRATILNETGVIVVKQYMSF